MAGCRVRVGRSTCERQLRFVCEGRSWLLVSARSAGFFADCCIEYDVTVYRIVGIYMIVITCCFVAIQPFHCVHQFTLYYILITNLMH